MKILFIANIPSPYNVEYLNELGKLAEVTAVFEMGSATDRDNSWKTLNVKNFSCIILNGIKFSAETALSLQVKKHIKKFRKEKIIIGNPTTPTGIIAILYCKKHKIPYILQSEGGFQGSGKGVKEKFKKYLMKDAILYLSGMKIENEYFLRYGATPRKIAHFPFTSFYASDIRQDIVSVEEKANYRKELGIYEEIVFISVGQFIYRKAFDILLKAYKGMPNNAGLYIIGGTPTEEYLKIVSNLNLKNVHFLNFMDKKTLKKYYCASDIFVLPTREDTWGLVVNEAMACGLPVITTDRCIAGISLINDGENGYIVPVNNVSALQEKMELLANNNELKMSMSKNNIEKISSYSYEEMAKAIYNALKEN